MKNENLLFGKQKQNTTITLRTRTARRRPVDLPVYMNLPGVPLQNCLDLYDSVTSTTPGMCLGGVCTRMACGVINWRRKDVKGGARVSTQQHILTGQYVGCCCLV